MRLSRRLSRHFVCLLILLSAVPTALPGAAAQLELGCEPEIVSVSNDGNEAQMGTGEVAMTPDARFVAFTSGNENLVPGEGFRARNVLVRDRELGRTILVSRGLDGSAANGWSDGIDISSNGRYVSFYSQATNLVLGDLNNQSDAFVADLTTGMVELVSVTTGGSSASAGPGRTSVSDDGRFVVFSSADPALFPDNENENTAVFVRDRSKRTTEGIGGTGSNGTISDDGRFVVFSGTLSRIGGDWQTLLYDRMNRTFTSVPIPRDPALSGDGTTVAGHNLVWDRQSGNVEEYGSYTDFDVPDNVPPALSTDGRHIAYQAFTVGPAGFGTQSVLVFDRQTRLATLASHSGESLYGESPSISANGRVVAYSAGAARLARPDRLAVYPPRKVYGVAYPRGTTHDVVFPGTNLSLLERVEPGPGISVKQATVTETSQLSLTLEIAPDAELGEHALTVVSRSGCGSSTAFRVSDELAADPPRIDFGGLVAGYSDSRPLSVFNVSDRSVKIDGFSVEGPAGHGFAARSSEFKPCMVGQEVAAGDRCDMFVSFTPSAAGARQATLVVVFEGRRLEVPLTGRQVERAQPQPAANQPAGRPSGYWLLARDGTVTSFGSAPDLAAPRRDRSVDIEALRDGTGFLTVDELGRVQVTGHAPGLPAGAPGLKPGERVVSLSVVPSGDGYWLFTSAGRVLPYGGAGDFGDLTGVVLNGPVLDSVATPTGQGYFMVASDGGVFAFGDARFAGSTGGMRLNAPVQSLVPDPDGDGYWLVAADGGVFAFRAGFRGSMGGTPLNAPMTGMVSFGDGYLMVAEDGGAFNFSSLPFAGSLGGQRLTAPIVAVAATI